MFCQGLPRSYPKESGPQCHGQLAGTCDEVAVNAGNTFYVGPASRGT
jgi:hypothetical protein